MDNEQTVYLFVKNYQDSLHWDEKEGLCEGKLVYGKHSEVIVYIEIYNKE